MSPKNGIFERGIFRVESWELRVERQIRLTKLCYFVTLLPMQILKFVIKTKRYLLAIYSVSTRYLPYFSWETFYPKIIKNGNYIRVDTDFILKTIIVNSDINFRQFRHQLSSISFYPKIVKNYRKLGKIFFRNKNTPSKMATKINKNQRTIFLFLL